MDTPITCLNGQFLHAAHARIPISDRGFRFGDGIFETIPVIEGVPCRWELHIERLLAGLKAIRIEAPAIDWQHFLRETLHQNRANQGFLRISISRGDGSIGYLPAPSLTATWAIEYLPSRPLPTQPYRLWLSSYQRPTPASLPTNHKLAQGLNSTLALMEAADHACDEALLLSAQGHICSAAAANIFWIRGERLCTAALNTGCLDGITRRTLLDLARIPVEQCTATLAEFTQADAVFLTSNRLGLWPVSHLLPSAQSFNPNHPIMAELQNLIAENAVNYINENSAYWRINS